MLAIQLEMVGKRLGSTSIVLRAKVFQAINLALLGRIAESKFIFKYCNLMVENNDWAGMTSFIKASQQWLKTVLSPQSTAALPSITDNVILPNEMNHSVKILVDDDVSTHHSNTSEVHTKTISRDDRNNSFPVSTSVEELS